MTPGSECSTPLAVGGPYGFEESVGAAGVKYTLIGLVCVPWIWSIPLALMTAEVGLCTIDIWMYFYSVVESS